MSAGQREGIHKMLVRDVVKVPRKFTSCVPRSAHADAIEIFQIREALELFAARFVIDSLENPVITARMQALIEEMAGFMSDSEFKDYAAFSVADNAFHNTLIDACNNRRLKTSYENLNIHMHIMRSHFFRPLVPPKRVHTEHLAILEAVVSKDAAAAERGIRQHLASTREKMINNIRNSVGVL